MSFTDMDQYFSGKELYGDNFTLKEIEKWYEDEKEGYADLVSGYNEYHYGYHHVNQLYGFNFLPKKKYNNVLGIGSAFGDEFKPIQSFINNLYILEPSDHLISNKIGKIDLTYKKPNIDGSIDFPDNFLT